VLDYTSIIIREELRQESDLFYSLFSLINI